MIAFLFVLAFLAYMAIVCSLGWRAMNAWDDGRSVVAVLYGAVAVTVFAGGLAYMMGKH